MAGTHSAHRQKCAIVLELNWPWVLCVELRRPRSGSDEIVIDRKAGGSHPGGHVQFAVDRAQVLANCARADEQPVRYFSVGQSLGDQAEHFELSLRKSARCPAIR